MLTRCVVVLGILAGILSVGVSGRVVAGERSEGYVGWKGCSPCHEEITKGWQKSRHARAYQSLKKTNQEHLPGCFRCHVTASDEHGGFIDYELTPELVDVQCEACHGPAGLHTANPGGTHAITAKPQEKVCRTCHTPGQDKSFDYKKKIRHVHGG